MKPTRRDFLRVLVAGTGTVVLGACGAASRKSGSLPTTRPTRPAAAPAVQASPSTAPTAAGLAFAPTGTAGAPDATAAASPRPTATATESDALTRAPAHYGVVTDTPAPAATARPTATPKPAATRRPPVGRGRRMWAWLRMMSSGDVPSSAVDYTGHLDSIDAALPLNGGKLRADGSWLQEDAKLRAGWPAGLRAQARSANQLYMPGMGNDAESILAVLDNPGVHDRAARDLVNLAKTRGDAPWDGVFLDIEAIPDEYRDRMSRLLNTVGRAVKDAGLLLGISVGGTTDNGKAVTDWAYDLSVVRDVADFVDLRCYDYFGQPRAMGPYWWMEGVVQYALKGGIPAGKIIMGQANYARFWPGPNSGAGNEMTYNQAMALLEQNGAKAEWVESEARGPVRERVAQIGGGRLVIHDGDTFAAGLNIVLAHGLLGAAVFVPGMGDDKHWQAIRNWRATYGVA